MKVRSFAPWAGAVLLLLTAACNGHLLNPNDNDILASPNAVPQAGTHAPAPDAPVTYSREWAVSPSGNDGWEGSPERPFRTLAKAIKTVGPGERLTVRAGTYSERIEILGSAKAGRPDAKITVQGEGNPRIAYRGAQFSLIQVERPHWIVEGLVVDVGRQKKVAVAFTGNVTGSTFRRSEAFGGTAGSGVTTFGGASDVTIEANDIHDFSEGSEDSHGVTVQPTSRNVTVRNNRIHDVSGDSVQCIGPEGYSSDTPADGVLIEGNELFHNRENAVDIKTCKNVTVRANVMHNFKSTGGCIVVVHMSASNVLIEDNDIFDAGKGIAIGGNHVGPPPSGVAVLRNRIYDLFTSGGMEGVGIRVENSTGAVVLNNTFARLAGAALQIGFGTGGATEDLSVQNNLVATGSAVRLGGMAPGLSIDHNLYQAGARFVDASGRAQDLGAWRSAGRDITSSQSSDVLQADWMPGQSAVDRGENVGLPYCGAAPDIGAVETGCAAVASS